MSVVRVMRDPRAGWRPSGWARGWLGARVAGLVGAFERAGNVRATGRAPRLGLVPPDSA